MNIWRGPAAADDAMLPSLALDGRRGGERMEVGIKLQSQTSALSSAPGARELI